MSNGYLTVQVTNGNEAVPISNATVKVLQNNNILYELTTDSSGLIERVELDTVARNLSLDPNYRGNPYTLYDVIVSAEGYHSMYIHGIRIFEGEHAIQAVSLIPLLSRNMETYDIYLGPAAIQLDQAHKQEGPRVEPRVLRQVIIPNPITVHLGAPTSSASNVQTSFINYVKNVASSEIYPTWPSEALKANIYAITTFALNRVFTEWYRTRGYNFDITNSTAYDQYYVYGQTIYESISKIVDEQFNHYVIRSNSTAPYFTSFCNGTTATCNGLSQWGTVTLANNGNTALNILKHYYGNDIEITETNMITDVISSYPGTALRLGSRGLDVQTIQVYLNRIRKSYPAIPAITNENGNFESSTEAAVKAFQRIFNLTVDGIVGEATWNQISRIYVAIVRLAELDAEGDALGIGTVPPNSILRLGSYGNDVLTLQYLLSYISLYYPTVSSPSSNGIFDKQTQDSVMAFQQMMGLGADGIVGINTWNALYEVYWGIKNNTSPTPPNPSYMTLYFGSRISFNKRSGKMIVKKTEFEQLHRYVEESSGNEKNICEITAVKNGSIVYEDYWHGFQRGDTLNIMSVTKSVMAILTGIAIDKGLIKSVDQKVLEFFPDYQVKRGEKTIYDVTLRHLLTMTAPYKYKSEPWTKVCTSDNWTKAALDILGGRSGITGNFKYSTLGIQILSGVISNASGMKLIDFANIHLFEKLGIPSHTNKEDSTKEEQFNFLMGKEPKGNVWYADPQNVNTAGWGLALSANDLAAIGLMCLQKGIYNGQRIVTEAWIDVLSTPYIDLDDRFGNMSYGFLWWIIDANKHIYAAIGDGGNIIYVNEEKGICVGIAGTFKPRIFDRVQFIQKIIEPLL